MTDYTPKDYEIRDAWQEFAFKDDGSHQDEFDRWLEEHDRQVSEDAWQEGRSYGMYDARAKNYVAFSDRPNPHRKDES